MIEQIVDLTKKLVSVESTDEKKENLQEVIDICVKELDGYTIEKFSQNGHPSILAYVGSQRPKQFDVIFNAHLDVVSAQVNQFTPVEKDGKLYGRGVSDMKAATAVELLAFKDIAKTISRPVALQLVTDEEIGGYDGTNLQIKDGVRTPFVIAGEPTDFGVGQKAKGVIWMNVKTKGTVAHGAYQWRGISAILKMNKAINAIEKEFPVLLKEEWRTTMNIAKIETSNTTYNKVPDDCLMKLDIRYIPEDWKTIKQKIEKMLEGFELEFLEFEPPQVTKETNPYFQQLLASIENVTSKKADVIVKHGSSDVRHFSRVDGEGVEFGPVGAGLHSDEEWVDIKSLGTYYDILSSFL
ncbi:MAG: M20/M25/M40 family metallo-hydrolase, partial [Candidatus Roizmanbacteria bacterium]|nr:M20/M25/M40 family metallo-hydrolase [Candidatus Roizmanbacteria bacterium]